MIYGGNSYTTHMKEEISGYRVVIGGKTCIFEKDNDPTVIRFVVGMKDTVIRCVEGLRELFNSLLILDK